MSYTPPNPNGQATMANSSPVVIASDQSDVNVIEQGELLEAIRQMQYDLEVLKNALSILRSDGSGRLRTSLDATSNLGTISTVTTVSSVTSVSTVSTVTNQGQIGGYQASEQVPALRRIAADTLLSKITIS